MLTRVSHEEHRGHLPRHVCPQHFAQPRMTGRSARLPGDSQPLGSSRQGYVVGRDAHRGVVLLGRLIIGARHGVGVNDYRRLQHLLTGGIRAALVAGSLQLELSGQVSRLCSFRALLIQHEETPRLRQPMVRRPDGGIQHSLDGHTVDRTVGEFPGTSAPVDGVIDT